MKPALGHEFIQPAWLEQALRHRSAGVPHNERLEFLGDAVLGLLIAEALHSRWPGADEGALTRARSQLVCESSLAGLARRLDLGERIVLGQGEMKSGGRFRDSILADALEAVVGAIYLDGGIEACRSAVLPWFEHDLEAMPIGKVEKDPKTRLQEWLQARQWPRPEYELQALQGPEHARRFLVQARAGEPPLTVDGAGASQRAAEQSAAAGLLAALEERYRRPGNDPASRHPGEVLPPPLPETAAGREAERG